jgi:iron complex outermembrane recepter protein
MQRIDLPRQIRATARRLLFIAAGWIGAPIFSLYGQPVTAATGTGTIAGRVQNVVTGQYLNNARVAVRGTDHVAFTDETGSYRLADVPSGRVQLDVIYTGLDPQQIAVDVAPGATRIQNIDLTSIARYGDPSAVVKLESFVVAASREIEGQSLAINEQRYAPNIKNVVSSDAHGDVTAGNVAELIKFIPGVTIIEGGDGNANQVSVRGLDSSLASVNVDGAQMAHAVNAGNTRDFDFKGININSVARVEITKVPTPSTPADTLGGSIDMVSKSAFERSKPELRYRAYFSVNGEDFTFRKTPFPYEKETYKAIPGFDLTYTKPVNQNFGFVVNAASNVAYNVQDIETMTWNGSGTGTGASPSRPYLQSYSFTDAPKYVYRQSASTRLDWRITPNSTLALTLLASLFRDDNAAQSWTFNAGTIGTPTPANGIPMSFTPDSTIGATGRGAVTMGGGHHHITQTLLSDNLRYRFDNGTWRVLVRAAHSRSRTYNNAMENYGQFGTLSIAFAQPVRLVFTGTSGSRPERVQAFNNNNQEVDLHDINNYTLNTATQGVVRNHTDVKKSGDLGVRRAFHSLPVPAALEIGGAHRIQERDSHQPSLTYTYNGIGGNRTPAPFAARIYRIQSPIGPQNMPLASRRIAFQAWEDNPALFSATPAQTVAAATSEITTSEYIDEAVSAVYAQAEVRLWQNRINLLGGVRFEKTSINGQGPLIDPAAVWQRTATGAFARTATGARIRRPEAGAVGSLEQLSLTHQERGHHVHQTYDGYYPSTHVTFNLRENLLLRLAYARTYGRPNFNEIIPNTMVAEEDVDLIANPRANPGSINIRNTALRPWTADNYDLSLEYYTEKGGLFSVGAFRKDISNFFGSIARIATAADVAEFDLDPRYVGWTLRTKINAGDARVSGVEFNVRHSLGFAGAWGQQIQGFVNGTKLSLEGNDEADWRGFTPEMLNWGFTFSRRPVTLMAQWSYRGESQGGPVPALGPNVFLYKKARTGLDLNVDYQVRRNFSFFVNVRNVLRKNFSTVAKGPETPVYAKHTGNTNNGTQYALGVKGTF